MHGGPRSEAVGSLRVLWVHLASSATGQRAWFGQIRAEEAGAAEGAKARYRFDVRITDAGFTVGSTWCTRWCLSVLRAGSPRMPPPAGVRAEHAQRTAIEPPPDPECPPTRRDFWVAGRPSRVLSPPVVLLAISSPPGLPGLPGLSGEHCASERGSEPRHRTEA